MTSSRSFEIHASQYEVFRLNLPRRSELKIDMIATEPVTLLVLNNEEFQDYEHGRSKFHEYTEGWPPKRDLAASIKLDAGTWHLVVEGHRTKSKGRIRLST